MEINEPRTVTLYLDGDMTLECEILCILDVGGREYIALLPPDDEDGEESPVYLYRYHEDAHGEPSLELIEDDDEFEAASKGYEQWLEDLENEAFPGEPWSGFPE